MTIVCGGMAPASWRGVVGAWKRRGKGRGAQLDYHEDKSGNSTGRGAVAEEIVGSAVRRRLVAVSKGKEGGACGVGVLVRIPRR